MLTTKGILWTAASAVLTLLGLAVSSPWAVIVGVGLGLHVALAWMLLSKPRIEGTIELGLVTVTEGDRIPVTLSIVSRSRAGIVVGYALALPPTFEEGAGPASGTIVLRHDKEQRIEIAPVPRLHGPWSVGPLEFMVRDPALLVSRTLEGAPARSIRVYPRIEDLKDVPLRSRLATPYIGAHEVQQPGDGFDLYALRGYRRGDPMRSINWRASARSRDLIVNQRVKESYASVTLVLDGRGRESAGILEHAPWWRSARAAIAIANAFARGRDRITFHLVGQEASTVQPQPAERQRRQVLDLLASHRPHGNASLVEWIGQAIPSLRSGSLIVIVSSLESEEGVGDAVARLRAREMPVLVVSPPSQWPEASDPDAQAARETRERNLARLKATGARVLDWTPGRLLSVALLEVVE